MHGKCNEMTSCCYIISQHNCDYRRSIKHSFTLQIAVLKHLVNRRGFVCLPLAQTTSSWLQTLVGFVHLMEGYCESIILGKSEVLRLRRQIIDVSTVSILSVQSLNDPFLWIIVNSCFNRLWHEILLNFRQDHVSFGERLALKLTNKSVFRK